MTYSKDNLSANLLQSSQNTSANMRYNTPNVFNQPVVLQAGITHRDSKIGYTASLGQIFNEDFAYKLEHTKQNNQSTILVKAAYGINKNWYLQGLYAELKKTGFEYSYEEFTQPNFLANLSFGEAAQSYNIKQKSFSIGGTYVD